MRGFEGKECFDRCKEWVAEEQRCCSRTVGKASVVAGRTGLQEEKGNNDHYTIQNTVTTLRQTPNTTCTMTTVQKIKVFIGPL